MGQRARVRSNRDRLRGRSGQCVAFSVSSFQARRRAFPYSFLHHAVHGRYTDVFPWDLNRSILWPKSYARVWAHGASVQRPRLRSHHNQLFCRLLLQRGYRLLHVLFRFLITFRALVGQMWTRARLLPEEKSFRQLSFGKRRILSPE